MNIAVSYNRRESLHYLLRIVPRGALSWDTGANCLGHLDGLLSSKMPAQLLQAIDAMPSLYPGGTFSGKVYWCELAEASKRLSAFAGCDEAQLEAELQIVAVKELRANNTRLTQFVAEYGKSGAEYADSLRYANGEECVLLVERLQDWMTLQSSLSLCARLRAQLERGDVPVSLEGAGFAHRTNTRLEDDFYIIPFKFNTFYAKEHVEGAVNDPLFTALAPWVKGKTRLSPIDQVYVRYPDKDNKDVFFATAPVATQEYPKTVEEVFIARRRSASVKTYYLLARDGGDQAAIARSIAASFTRAFRTLQDPGDKKGRGKRDLGWTYDAEGEFDGAAGPRLVPQSLPSALWQQLVYHPGMRTIACAYCGNAVLAREQGNQKHYCSPSCRVQDAKRAKARRG